MIDAAGEVRKDLPSEPDRRSLEPVLEQAADSPWLDSLYEADAGYRAFVTRVDDQIIK